MSTPHPPTVGAWPTGQGCRFRVWAPYADGVEVRVLGPAGTVALKPDGDAGHWTATVPDVGPGDRYWLRLDDGPDRPDPASLHQPEGLDGPSAVIDADFAWTDGGWQPPPLRDWVIYECHMGTYTTEGTFDALVGRLPELVDLGVTALELMPVAQFPGTRNWGYDGVLAFAAQHSYGGIDGLRRLVDAAHGHGLAVVLDVVHNHVGPEGNHLGEFGPFFTDRYHTPWGPAVNLDDHGSDGVREHLIESALFWVTHAHVDGLRLDAVHSIVDLTAMTFLEELTDALHCRGEELGRAVTVVAESAANDPRLVRSSEAGGFGMDAMWNDDFHHALAVSLGGARDGYYGDYRGVDDLARAFTEGFVYTGRHSTHLDRRQGRTAPDVALGRMVVCSQNHDQIGNRPLGDRPTARLGPDKLRLAATTVLLSPFLPLLFMGEEHTEAAPFAFFTSHTDPVVIDRTRSGRAMEFAAFAELGAPPDPQAESTFLSSKVGTAVDETGAAMRRLYRELLSLRRETAVIPACTTQRPAVAVDPDAATIDIAVGEPAHPELLLHLAFNADTTTWTVPPGSWQVRLDTAGPPWGGRSTSVADVVDGGAVLQLEPWSALVLTPRPEANR